MRVLLPYPLGPTSATRSRGRSTSSGNDSPCRAAERQASRGQVEERVPAGRLGGEPQPQLAAGPRGQPADL